MIRRAPLVALVAACFAASSTLASQTPESSYTTSLAALQRRLEAFADDSMAGRSWSGVGHDRATAYIAREASLVGLEPAGENGGWFQTLHMYSRRIAPQSSIGIKARALLPARDFKMFSFGKGPPRSLAGVQVVYGGIVGDSTTQISAEEAASRVVLLGVPADMTPERVYRNAGYGPTSRFGRAAAVAIASLDYLPTSQRGITSAVGLLDSGTPRADAAPSTLLVTRDAAALMLGRTLEGAVAGTLGQLIEDHLMMDERDVPTRNVIGVLRGRDSTLAGTYVALGAHSDHIGLRDAPVDHDSIRAVALAEKRGGEGATAANVAALRDSLLREHHARLDSIFNGADDDGSGVVALIEAAHVMATGPRPRRSVLFIWHAAEEDGLVGSGWFVEHPTVPLDSITAYLNLDMVGRGGIGDLANGGPRYLRVVGTSRRSPELWPLIEQVNAAAKTPFALDTADLDGGFCRSDQWSYSRYGIPVAFLTTGSHIDYHSITDEARYIDYAKLSAVTGFTIDLARTLADRPSRLRVEGEPPNPKRFCGAK
jgi:hypothetical protein